MQHVKRFKIYGHISLCLFCDVVAFDSLPFVRCFSFDLAAYSLLVSLSCLLSLSCARAISPFNISLLLNIDGLASGHTMGTQLGVAAWPNDSIHFALE